MTPLEQLLFTALQSASAALTNLDPMGENHDSDIIDTAMGQYRQDLEAQRFRPDLKVVKFEQGDPTAVAIRRVHDAINMEGINPAQQIAVLHLALHKVTAEIHGQMNL